MKPRLLDLFCGAGGCTKGYQRAGFYVVGVDNRPQPRYCDDEFWQTDALDALWTLLSVDARKFAAIHASPPCQFATDYRRRPGHVKDSPNLIPATRDPLELTGLPYVIENVERAAEYLRAPVRLCGTGFGLDVERHRLFETNWPLLGMPCAHGRNAPRFPGATNRRPNSRRTVEIGVWRIPLDVQRRAMGIDWMTLEELSEAIPPAYTELIGHQLMQHVRGLAA